MNGSQKNNAQVYGTAKKPEGIFAYGSLVLLIVVALMMVLAVFWFLGQKDMNIVDPLLKVDQALQNWKDGQKNSPYKYK